MTFMPIKFVELMLSCTEREKQRKQEKTDVQRGGGECRKERGGADQKGNRERKEKQQGRWLCGRKR